MSLFIHIGIGYALGIWTVLHFMKIGRERAQRYGD